MVGCAGSDVDGYLTLKRIHVHSWTDKVLPPIDNPLESGNDEHDSECRNTVVYKTCVSLCLLIIHGDREGRRGDLLMLLPVTGRSGGNKNSTVVRVI